MGKDTLKKLGLSMDIVERTDTPFYYYDMSLLATTLQEIKRQIA